MEINQTTRKNTEFEITNNNTKAIVLRCSVQTKQIINQLNRKLEIQACHIYVSKRLHGSLLLHLRGKVCGFALTFSTHESQDDKYVAHTHTHTESIRGSCTHNRQALQSGWSSGLRRSVKVAVSSDNGVLSYPGLNSWKLFSKSGTK